MVQSEPLQRLFINKLREVGVAWQKQLPNQTPRSSRSCLCSVHAIRNTRRKMEDRHVMLSEFDQLFGLQVRGQAPYHALITSTSTLGESDVKIVDRYVRIIFTLRKSWKIPE